MSERSQAEILDRAPPQDLEAERGVLGSIFVAPEVLDDIASIVKPEHFHGPHNRVLYQHLLAARDAGEPIDPKLLHERLKKSGDLGAAGGLAYLAEVADAVLTAHNAVYYAQIVREKAGLRAIRELGCNAIQSAHEHDADPLNLVAAMQAQLDRIAETGATSEAVNAACAVAAAVGRMRERASGDSKRSVPTGFDPFDQRIGGLFAGELFVLGARPRVGKTSMGVQVAAAAAQRKHRVLFISTEMDAAELMGRLLCGRAGVDSGGIRVGRPCDGDLDRIDEAAAEAAKLPLWIDDRPAVSVRDIRWQARRIRKRHGLDLLVVDYLQRLKPADARVKRYEQVGQMARDLKHLARELGIPVLCLAQLGREAEASGDSRPKLSHLRESGDVEAEADVVAFLHRPELHGSDPDLKGQAELIVEKNRNGRTETFKLCWHGPTTRFISPIEFAAASWDVALEAEELL